MTAAPEPARPVFDLSPASYDGNLIGALGEYPPGTPLSQIGGVQPTPPGGPPTQKIIYVNGIMNSPNDHYDSLKAIADNANAEVVGIYNSSEGTFKDLLQCVKDKLGIGHNPAVDTLRDTLYAELKSDSQQPVNLMAHSQGALITSRALGEVRHRLEEDGLSSREIDQRLSRINIETFGGAAWTYPDGPHYNHHTNVLDPVSNMFGQGTLLAGLGVAAPPLAAAAVPALNAGVTGNPAGGEGSRQHVFAGVALNPHDFTGVYLKHWESPFPRNAPQ
jgi:hypothetical protein